VQPNRLLPFTRSTYAERRSGYACRALVEVDVQEKYIALLQRSGEVEEFPAGATIFSEGDEADRMYVISDGTVSLSIDGDVVETLGPGGLFGEMAVIDREPRSASAVAESDATLVAIDKRRFWFLVQETPYFAEIVMRVMSHRLRRESPPHT
jgi:CRP/FNR family transcriptional regulator, cyclic AMP receptor protein